MSVDIIWSCDRHFRIVQVKQFWAFLEQTQWEQNDTKKWQTFHKWFKMVVAYIYICELIAIITKPNKDVKQNAAYKSPGFYTDMIEHVAFNQTGFKKTLQNPRSSITFMMLICVDTLGHFRIFLSPSMMTNYRCCSEFPITIDKDEGGE